MKGSMTQGYLTAQSAGNETSGLAAVAAAAAAAATTLTAPQPTGLGPCCLLHAVCVPAVQTQTLAVKCKEEGDDVFTLGSGFLPRVLH